MCEINFVMIIRWKDNYDQGFTNYGPTDIYLGINLELTRLVQLFNN
jgi:hypothetical protein